VKDKVFPNNNRFGAMLCEYMCKFIEAVIEGLFGSCEKLLESKTVTTCSIYTIMNWWKIKSSQILTSN